MNFCFHCREFLNYVSFLFSGLTLLVGCKGILLVRTISVVSKVSLELYFKLSSAVVLL